MSNERFTENLIVIDNAWGNISIPPAFCNILYHPAVQALKFKKQLGMTARNPSFSGGYHTRYDHAIGVYHVATKLVSACKRKFKNFFEITEKEENAFYLSALLHDLGHKSGSHAFERFTKISHEEETYNAILKMKSEIDKIFGEGTCYYVLEILGDKNKIKKEAAQKESNKIDLLFVLSELMIGSVDIDRIDYVIRDYLNIYGEKKDFSVLFEHMELELVNNRPKIVFNESALDILEDYLMTRFRLYNEVHFHPNVIIQDEYFKKFILSHYSPDTIDLYFTETQLNFAVSDVDITDIKEKRFIDLLDYGDFSSILYKRFESKQEADIFWIKLSTLIDTEDTTYCGYLKRKVTIYDKEKNSILLKSNCEIVDFTNISKIIKDKISQNTICIYVDMILLKERLFDKSLMTIEQINDKLSFVNSLFTSSDKEVEYKFTLSDVKGIDDEDNTVEVNIIKKLFEKCSNIASTMKEQVNEDVYYYVPDIFESKDGSVRIRHVDGKIKPTIKFTLEDETSITKRDEHNFQNMSEEEFLNVANKILNEKGFCVDLVKEHATLKIKTIRRLYTIKKNNSTIELALDKSMYTSDRNSKPAFDLMIEIELKKGETLELWKFVNNMKDWLGKENLVVCSESKLSRAVKALR